MQTNRSELSGRVVRLSTDINQLTMFKPEYTHSVSVTNDLSAFMTAVSKNQEGGIHANSTHKPTVIA